MISIALPPKWRDVWSGAGETFGGGAMVQAYAKHYGWHDCIVLLVMDNIAAICYWNKQGHSSDEDLNEIMRPFFEFLRLRAIMVIATYCPAGAIIVADEPSRRPATVWEYFLRHSIFRDIGVHSPGRKRRGDIRSVRIDGECADEEVCVTDAGSVRGVGGLHQTPLETAPEQLLRVPTTAANANTDRESGGRGADPDSGVTPAWMKLHIKRITEMLVAVPLVTPWRGRSRQC